MSQFAQLTTPGSIRKFKFLLLGGRPMVGLQTLDLAIGVRVPASQPKDSNTYGRLKFRVARFCVWGYIISSNAEAQR